jgi:bifunctional UDP-N-acetylglucosamine pyrophosphorylase/glucosamine-1-phosphate N-acetyltransferase
MPGDIPLISKESLAGLKKEIEDGADAALLTAILPDPYKYGRIIRDEAGNVRNIVEERDCTPSQRAIREINTGVMCFKTRRCLM